MKRSSLFIAVVLSLIFWGWVWGAVGMVLAVPITMVIRILLEQSDESRWAAVLIAGSETSVPAPAADAGKERASPE